MGSAEPVQSPQSSDPAGDLVDFEPVSDVDETNGRIGVRTSSALTIGTLEEIQQGKAARHELDQSCGEASANAGTFALACAGEIKLFGDREETIATDKPVTAATVASS